MSTVSLSQSINQYSLQEARLRTGRSVYEQVALSGSPYRIPHPLLTVPPLSTVSHIPDPIITFYLHTFIVTCDHTHKEKVLRRASEGEERQSREPPPLTRINPYPMDEYSMPSVGDSSTPLPYPILQSVVGAAAAAIEIVNASELGSGSGELR